MTTRVPTSRRLLGLAISAAGLIALIAGGMQAADLRGRLGPTRLLIGPSAVLVTPDGTVVVASPTFSKIHLYEPSGRALRAWQVPAEGGPFRIGLSGPDRLQVAPERTGRLLEYDLEGEQIGESEDQDAFARLARDGALRSLSAGGATIAIEGGRVVRYEGGERRVLVDGFESHGALTLAMVRVVVLLLTGSAALVGGVLLTARRAPGAPADASRGSVP